MKYSKHPIFIYIFLLYSFNLAAQVKPDNSTRAAATAISVPTAYTNTTINYVRMWEPDIPLTDTAMVIMPSRKVAEVKQTTQYFDGLGRPIQSVIKGISYGGRDIVTPVVYDGFDREQYKYMSYAQSTGNVNDGKFKTDPFNAQKAFYQDATFNPGITGENIYYSNTVYEFSPLNRMINSYAPGNSWVNHPVSNQYLLNTVADSVHIWNINAGMPSSSGIYAVGDIYKNVTTDEMSNQVIEYKDKDNRLVLKKVQQAGTFTAHTGWLCTYYVYDNLGHLCFIIPPMATEYAMRNGWNVTPVVGELCFQYLYDERERMIIKKIPGAGRLLMVYDIRDRLVFSQDSIQRMKSPMEWMVTFYDGLNRPVITGIYTNTTTREALQTSMNTAVTSQVISYPFPGKADLALYNHDGSSLYQATNSIAFMNNFDSGSGSEFTAEINPSATGGTTSVMVTNPMPNISSSALIPLAYTFYDNYNYAGKLNFLSSDANKPEAADSLFPEALPVVYDNQITGLITGTKMRVLGTDNWLTSTSYYNKKGRLIQVVSENNLGGQDIQTTLYNFKGNVLSTYLRHQHPKSITPEITLLTAMTYDHGGRPLTVRKRINDDAGSERIISANTYSETGQLIKKRIGVTTDTQLDVINYTYNIRDWVQGINKSFVNTADSKTSWFGEEISYDFGFSTNQFNGNVAGVKWKSQSDGITRAFGYSYDKVNRLTAADFSQQNTTGATWANDKVDFSVSNLNYDANGNIKTMSQKGMVGAISRTIDQMTYSYASGGSNKLLSVSDTSNTASAKLGDFINGTNTGDDYKYDVNGNLTKDLNKGIDTINYNHLNLPSLIKIRGKGTIAYLYDAAGNKLKKVVTDSTRTTPLITVTDYIGSFVYRQDTLQFLSHEEGRIRPVYKTGQSIGFTYDYFEKDHLGNVRVVLGTQNDTSKYSATLETAASATENTLFSNIDNTRKAISEIAGYPTDNTTNPNAYVAKLNAINGQKIGPSLVLRVMAGDTIQMGVKAFYKSTGTSTSSTTSSNMLTALLQAFSGGSLSDGTHNATAAASPISTNFSSMDYDALKQKDPSQNLTDKPKSYLNYALFDDRFSIVTENSGVRQVQGSPDQLQTLGTDRMVIKKTGFLYIYTSNESGEDVFFDNLVVIHNGGPLLEETHYYPFGLTMAGISSNALKGTNYVANRKKYNGIESTTELDLNTYDAYYRNLDPQLGRWWQVDPKTEAAISESPYVSMGNNPVKNTDPLGDYFFGLFGSTSAQRQAAKEVAAQTGGQVINKLRRNIHVNYSTSEKTFNPETGTIDNTAVGHTVSFRENGHVETGSVVGNDALDKQIAYWSNHTVDSKGNIQFLPASGRAEYVPIESLLVPLPPVLRFLGRSASVTESITINAVGTGTEGALPMTVVELIPRGTKIADIVDNVKQLTFTTGNEHAVVTLANGERAIVSGGPRAIEFKVGQIQRLFGHSHPYDLLSTGPSIGDRAALGSFEQSSSYLLERGELYKFWAK